MALTGWPTARTIGWLLTAATLVAGVACQEEIVGVRWGDKGPFNASHENKPAPPPPKQARSSKGSGEGSWAIALDRLSGHNHAAAAEQRRAELARQSGLKDVWVSDEGEQSLIYYRRYKDSDDPAARTDLSRWQALARAGHVRLGVLMLVPVIEAGSADVAAYDLRSVKGRGIYTLQVAFFDREHSPEFRRAAEDAVASLRRDNHEAFYYHGPQRSMVTVGVFGPDAVVGTATGNQYSAAVQAMQARFPHNCPNSLKAPAGVRPQPSLLVRVPGTE